MITTTTMIERAKSQPSTSGGAQRLRWHRHHHGVQCHDGGQHKCFIWMLAWLCATSMLLSTCHLLVDGEVVTTTTTSSPPPTTTSAAINSLDHTTTLDHRLSSPDGSPKTPANGSHQSSGKFAQFSCRRAWCVPVAFDKYLIYL